VKAPNANASFRRLEKTDWNGFAAARILNVERTNLHKRIRARPRPEKIRGRAPSIPETPRGARPRILRRP
jgi:hypothetical protein